MRRRAKDSNIMACKYPDSEELYNFLKSIRLEGFNEIILEQRVISVEELQDIPDEMFLEMGMNNIEVNRLKRKLLNLVSYWRRQYLHIEHI